MWWSKGALLSLCLMLTACGFRPLYMTPSSQAANVCYPLKIGTIEDRHGQILRNYLVDMLIPFGPPKRSLYRLDVRLTEATIDIGVRKDETSRRKQLTLTAHIELKNADYEVVYKQTTSTINSYDILTTDYYADDVATQYAAREGARMLAEKIRVFVTAYLESHPCPPCKKKSPAELCR